MPFDSTATRLTRESQDFYDKGELYRSHRDIILRKSLDFDMCHYIFSKVAVEDRPQVMRLVSFIILTENVYLPDISAFFEISIPRICTTLGGLGLANVMNRHGENLVLLHASLPDFFLDEARSQTYYIDPTEWKTRLCIISLTKFTLNSKGMIVPSFAKHYRAILIIQWRRLGSNNLP